MTRIVRVGSTVALAASLAASGLSAQVGEVVDGATGVPIPGARIRWTEPGEEVPSGQVIAGGQGQFRVPPGWQGAGTIEVRAIGYAEFVVPREVAEGSAWRLVLDADPLDLDAVVVTVAGRSQRLSEVAVPVQRISTREIQVSGAESVESLLTDLPGLQTVSGAPTGSNVMIRGIGDSRVLILMDGEPVGGALLENRDLSRLSLAGVERVEVVKGPLSSIYGSDALGGVVNVITGAPERGFRLDGKLLQGGDGRQEAEATLAGGAGLRYRVTGAWREQNRVPGLATDIDAFSRVWDLRSSVRFGSPNDLRIRADFALVRERQKWPVGGGFSGFNDNLGLTGWVEVGHPLANGSLTARVFAQDYDHLYRSSRTAAPIAGADEGRQEEGLWKTKLEWSSILGEHGVDLGVVFARREIKSPDKLLEDRASDTQFEAFAQDAWRLGSTTLTGGVRGTFNDRWGDAFSPAFGLSSLVSEDVRVRASVGRGFRSPSFKELAWDFANIGAGYTVRGFPDLSPERSWNVSGGVEWAPTPRLSVEVEAYTNEIEDLIEFRFFGNTPSGLQIYSPQNVSRARTRGLEAGFGLRNGRWRVSGDYAFLDARSLDDDLVLDRRARHSAKLGLGADFPLLEGLSMDLEGHLTGAAPIIGAGVDGNPARVDTQERLVALDAQLVLSLTRSMRLVAGGDNLFDNRPDGWPSVQGRRLRVGFEAVDLF